MKSVDWPPLIGCTALVGLLAFAAVSMYDFTSRSYTPEEASLLFCGDMAEDHFGAVSITANSSFIKFDEASRVLYDQRSSEHFSDIELANARFNKPRVLERTDSLTVIALGNLVFLVSKDNKIQSIVRRRKFGEIKGHLIQEISDELTRRASKDGVSTPLESTRSSPARVRSKQPTHLVRPMANRTPSGHRDIPTPTAGLR